MIIFDFSGLEAKYYLDKPRAYRFHPKVKGQALFMLLYSQAVLRVDEYEFGSFSVHTRQNWAQLFKANDVVS